MSIDHGKLLALALQKVNYVHQSLLANRVVSGSFAVDDETCCRWANALNVAGAQLDRALAQPAEAEECGACAAGCKDGCRLAKESPSLLYEHADDGIRIYGYPVQPAEAVEGLREFIAAQRPLPADMAAFVSENWHKYADFPNPPTDAAQGAVVDVALTARKLLADQFPHQITKDLLVIDGRTDGVVDTTLALAAIEAALRTHPQAAPAQGGGDEWGSRMRRLARVGPFTAQPGERYIDEDVAVIVLRRALAAAPSQEGES